MDSKAFEMPDGSNFFSSLYTSISRQSLADLFVEAGWSKRKCGWHEYEVHCNFGYLVIEAESPILIHGPIADIMETHQEVTLILKQAGQLSFECYDEDMNILVSDP